MIIEKNKAVSFSYTLQADGMTVDSATETSPLEYIHGTGVLLKAFEDHLEGLSEGDTFEFTLPPEQGYGLRVESDVMMLPKEAFTIGGQVREDLMQPGRTLPMLDSDGNVRYGLVCSVDEDGVKMDFNHPLAGHALCFSGKVTGVREATEKELSEGLHGEYLPPEEGCCHRKGKCHHGHGHGEGEGCCHNGEGKGHCHHGEDEGHCCHHEGDERCSHHEGNEGCCHKGEGEGHCY